MCTADDDIIILHAVPCLSLVSCAGRFYLWRGGGGSYVWSHSPYFFVNIDGILVTPISLSLLLSLSVT